MVNRQPFTGTGRAIENGALAARRQDLVAHSDGNTLRHKADQIDMNPALSGVGLSDPTLQGTLEKISDFISQAGQGFITIGDGYDTGDFTVGSVSTPTLETAFEAAFDSPRLQNGGVILVKAGTYRMGRTVVVPAGITIMGEPSGTYILSSTNQQPIFEVSASPAQYDLGNWLGVTPNLSTTGVQFNKFYNLIIADNLDGYKGASPTIPNTITSGNLALIQCRAGSYVICERVTFLGRVDVSLNPQVVSRRAIDYTGSSGNPTVLHIEDCYFDAFENCITFTPPPGANNFLVVKGCRMRFVGQHLVGAAPDRSSAISFNLCNANIENNYILADFFGKYAIHLRNSNMSDSSLLEGSGATDKTIPRLIISGNSGGVVGSTEERNENFFLDSSTNSAYRSAMHGNTWGLTCVNGWYVTIGDGKNSVGDLIGPKALDVAVYMADTSGTRAETTFIINPGSYTITQSGTNARHTKLIGNIRSNGERPVLNLDCSTDDAFNRKMFRVGHEIRNIKFTTSGSDYNVIRLGVTTSNTARHYIVDNCEFDDAGLSTDDVSLTGTLDNQQSLLLVSRCRFNQSGDFADDISLVIRGAWYLIDIKDCVFTGHGYALGTTSTLANQVLKIRDTIFNSLGDGSTEMISAASPGAGTLGNSYISILNTAAKVSLDNVSLISVLSSTPQESLPVASSLRTSGSFTKYISISCLQLTIHDCVLATPVQSCVVSSVTYAVAGLYIDVLHSLMFDKSEFRGGPVYVGGTLLNFLDTNAINVYQRAGAYCSINNCIFASYADISGTRVNSTLLNLDLRPYESEVNNIDHAKPMLIIEGCQFDNYDTPSGGSGYFPVQYSMNTQKEFALVEIIARGWPVKFSNNTVHSRQPNSNGDDHIGTIVGTSAVFIDTITDDSTTNSVLLNATSIINNNHILLNTVGTDGSSSYHYSVLSVRSTYAIITGNFLQLKTSTTSQSTPYRTLIWFEGSEQSSYNDASVISGNILSRVNALSKAAVVFNRGRQGGIFVDNMFDHYQIASGASTAQFTDNTDNLWSVSRNRNQLHTFNLSASHGVWEIDGEINGFVDPNDISVGLTADVDGDDAIVSISQGDTSGNHSFSWYVPLISVLPIGARILSISCAINLSPAWTVQGVVKMEVQAINSTDKSVNLSMTGADPTGSISWSGGSQAENLIVTPENNPCIRFSCSTALRTGSPAFAEISYVQIQYVM